MHCNDAGHAFDAIAIPIASRDERISRNLAPLWLLHEQQRQNGLQLGGRDIDLGITQLPNLYRFKAGGSRSVRGYGFEELSDYDLGSNNIFTASAEVEMKFLESWSAAAFFDIGNAFNDWDNPNLKKGVGVGIRWYTIAGAIRVDYARAVDFEGKPWRVHFTIGIPLL